MNKKLLFDNTTATSRTELHLDTEAFVDLYRAYTYAVFNYCLFCIGDPAVAEDLTADAFERAWRARHSYRPDRAAFSTWLFTIARRTVIDWQRRRARRPFFRLNHQQPSEVPSPELQVEETERQSQLRRLVQALGPDDQELIALKFGAGMTNRQIAELLGKSETAIGSAIYRVMQKLRARWE